MQHYNIYFSVDLRNFGPVYYVIAATNPQKVERVGGIVCTSQFDSAFRYSPRNEFSAAVRQEVKPLPAVV